MGSKNSEFPRHDPAGTCTNQLGAFMNQPRSKRRLGPETLLVVRFAYRLLCRPVDVLLITLMLLQVRGDVRAMRNDALA